MEPELGAEGGAVEAELSAWRRKAAGILLAASAVVHLPVFVAMAAGFGPTAGPLVRAIAVVVYLIIVAAALLRRVELRTRLLASAFAVYLAIAVTNLALPHGPYAQVGLVTVPVFVLVLLGAPAARNSILASAIILVSAPLLQVQPRVAQILAIDPAEAQDPLGVVWVRAAGMTAFLVVLMVLLDRFHRFLLVALAAQCRTTAEREREMRERQRLEREIAAIGDGERRRLGQELHDGVCQQVTAALLRCQALERRAERGGTLSGAELAPLSSLLAESIDEAHNVALGLCPLEPDPDALSPALRALTKRIQEMGAVRCEYLVSGDLRVPDPAMAQHLYRIAQEALSNAARHAHAGRIALELRGSDSELLLQVEDDGAGLPAELPAGGLGLRTMAYRARILEGELTVAPAPGGGTRIACRVPRSAGPPAKLHPSGEERWIPAT